MSSARFLVASVALLAALALPCARAAAQDAAVPPAPEQKFILASGDTLTGSVISEDAEFIVIRHATLGVLKIPKNALAPPPAIIDVPVPEQAPPASPWSGTFDAGVTGASGNTNQEHFRTAFVAQHKTEMRVIDLNAVYRYAKEDGDATEDNGLAEGRVTWPEADSPWGTFVGAAVERDRFKDFDYRVRFSAGRSYDFEDTKETFLQGRFGLGVSRDFGGDEGGWSPEGVLGVDYRHELSPTSKITASSEVLPILDDLFEFRSISRAAWENKLAETSPWLVKLGVEHQYDSDAGDDVKATDWTYFASIGYAF